VRIFIDDAYLIPLTAVMLQTGTSPRTQNSAQRRYCQNPSTGLSADTGTAAAFDPSTHSLDVRRQSGSAPRHVPPIVPGRQRRRIDRCHPHRRPLFNVEPGSDGRRGTCAMKTTWGMLRVLTE
jgi:hypothetical protein